MTRFITNGVLDLTKHRSVVVERPKLKAMLEHINSDDLYIALHNPRQTGKTTTLYQIQKSLHGKSYGVAYIDLEGQGDMSKEAFYRWLANEILQGLDKMIECGSTEAPPLQSSVDQNTFAQYLRWLSAHSPQARKLIIILDKVGDVPAVAATTFFPALRKFHGIGRNEQARDRELHQKIMFVFSGSLDMRRLIQGPNSPISGVWKEFDLDDFTREEVRALAANLESFPDTHVPIIADAVYAWTSGHPYLTQRLLALIDGCNDCRVASIAEVADIIKRLTEQYILLGQDGNLAHILKQLRENREYSTAVFKVLEEAKRKTVGSVDDLLSIGVLKKETDLSLAVRNKIYVERLRLFFDEKEEGSAAPKEEDAKV
jgi:hypothetical protein